jgi:uncharacterized membrane protein
MQRPDPTDPPLASVVHRNIRALVEVRAQQYRNQGLQDRAADLITGFTGSMTFVYVHLLLFGVWIVWNLGWIPQLKPFDPSFVVLAMAASVEAIFLSTFVLISQNRMLRVADQRADLNLQISLLTEHELTRLIQMVDALSDRLGLDAVRPPDLEELKRDVQPEAVLHEIHTAEEAVTDQLKAS